MGFGEIRLRVHREGALRAATLPAVLRSLGLPVRLLLVLLLVAVVLGPGAVLGYTRAQALQRDVVTRFNSAQAHLERARTLVGQASGPQAQTGLAQARLEFQRAAADFRAGGALVASPPLSWVPERVPVAGAEVAAVAHLSAMGLALCDAGLLSVDIDSAFLEPAAPGQPTGTARLVGVLDRVQATLPALAGDLDRAQREVKAVDPAALPASQRASLQRARDDIARGVAGIAELGRLVPAIGDILGVDGHRVYVVEQVNPFELRAGGGYIGTYSLLSADRGSLSVLRSGDTHDLPDYTISSGQAGYVAPPAPMLGLLHDKTWSFQDSNFYPDFRDDARAAAQFAQRDFGTGVDGVISIDLYAVAALLGVTGPISVPGSRIALNKDNAIPTIMAGDLVSDPTHKQVIASVAGPLMQRLVALDTSQWLGLIQVLNQLASQRHLQLFFASDRVQPEMERLGLTGSLAFAGHDDFLHLSEANFGGNKANYFLTRTLDLALSRAGDQLHHVLTEDLTLDLRTAPGGYVVPYTMYARILLPAGATGVDLSGLGRQDQPAMTPPAGVQVAAGAVEMRVDSAHTAHLRIGYTWNTPWIQDASGAHRIYWQKQPGVAQDAVSVTWAAGGRTATARAQLATDLLVTLDGGRVEVTQGNAAQVALPRI